MASVVVAIDQGYFLACDCGVLIYRSVGTYEYEGCNGLLFEACC